jgi:tetratricopeptide (TPR) repeat protein
MGPHPKRKRNPTGIECYADFDYCRVAMKFPLTLLSTLLLLGSLVLSGCIPSSQGQSDEEKEPHFLAGNSHVNAMDFKSAIESYEKAIEVNPKSGAAHFELGWLLDRKEGDPAGAIYHYERYLRLRPNAKNIEVVKQQITACKQELARTVSLGPVSDKQQRDLEKTVEENKKLTEENKRLTEELAKWRASAISQAGLVGSRQAAAPGAARSDLASPLAVPQTKTNSIAQASSSVAPRRSYTVKAGDTPTSIAKQLGVKIEALTAANPKLEARRMRVGQVLNVP